MVDGMPGCCSNLYAQKDEIICKVAVSGNSFAGYMSGLPE